MSNISHSMLLGEWCCVSGVYLVNVYWLSLKEGERERWGGRVVPLRLRGCNWAAAASLRGGHWPLCHPLSTFRWHASKKKEAWHRDKQIDKQVDRQTSRQTDRKTDRQTNSGSCEPRSTAHVAHENWSWKLKGWCSDNVSEKWNLEKRKETWKGGETWVVESCTCALQINEQWHNLK